MSDIVKVWNNNIYPFVQKFKGENIAIQPKSYIEMVYEEAVLFRGEFAPIVRDASGQDDPRYFKMIAIDPEDEKRILSERSNKEKGDGIKEKYVCHVCAKDFLTKKGLLKHIKANHLDQMADEDARDELIDDEDI